MTGSAHLSLTSADATTTGAVELAGCTLHCIPEQLFPPVTWQFGAFVWRQLEGGGGGVLVITEGMPPVVMVGGAVCVCVCVCVQLSVCAWVCYE